MRPEVFTTLITILFSTTRHAWDIDGIDQHHMPEGGFFPDQIIVELSSGRGDYESLEHVIQRVENDYDISIQIADMNPSGVGNRIVERHFWDKQLAPSATEEIKNRYRDAGYRAYLSHAYPVFYSGQRLGVGRSVRNEETGQYLVDPLLNHQSPYPFGDDDRMGFTDNEGGYLRLEDAAWPPKEAPRGEVLLVLSDTGLYWRYEDFIANLWQNPGEDHNGDGTIVDLGGGAYDFDLTDLDGVDDDGNGYDDLIGYDFIGDSPDPTHYEGEFFTHGTAVYSVIASETGNGVDMAGALFPGYVKVVPTKVGWGLLIDEAAAIEGIYYAATLQAQGYQVVLNMSWGGGEESEPLKVALDAFTDLGGLAIAAAGNEMDGEPKYPAGCSDVMAVSASNIENKRAGFSNYGAWVDIAAPGEDILAAYYLEKEGFTRMLYAPLDGTSFSAPIVSAMAAMYWAIHPELSPSEVEIKLLTSVYTPEDYPWNPPGSFPQLCGPPGLDPGNPFYGEGILDGALLFSEDNGGVIAEW
jgi:subtilisin family serine protease